MKVLITSRSFGKIGDSAKKVLTDAGIEIDNISVGFDQAHFEKIIPEYDALIIGAHDFSEADMERCPNLKIICKHGVGLDNIHVNKAKELGIAVCNAPGTNSNAVADLALGLMLSVCRKISHSAALVREGVWKSHIGEDVCGKTVGLLGFGAIAKGVARRARGFGMNIMAFDPFVPAEAMEAEGVIVAKSLEDLYENSHFVSLHIPATEQTKNSIGYNLLSRMPKGGCLVNTARKEVINEEGLIKALKEREDLKYITDVPTANHAAMAEEFGKRVFGTPKKMGAETGEANVNAGLAAANQIVDFFTTGNTKFQVNKQ